MSMDDFHGVLAVLCTPFMPDESLDYDSLRRLTDHVLDEGAHAVVCLGLASETNRLSEEEKLRVVQTVVAQVGDRVPVISGLQAAATVEAVRMARGWWEAGVVGLMVLPPPGPVDAAACRAVLHGGGGRRGRAHHGAGLPAGGGLRPYGRHDCADGGAMLEHSIRETGGAARVAAHGSAS